MSGKTELSREKVLETVGVLALACLVAGHLLRHRPGPARRFLAAATLLLAAGLFVKPAAALIAPGLAVVRRSPGRVNSRIILGAIFYLFLTPIAFLARLTRGDLLHLKQADRRRPQLLARARPRLHGGGHRQALVARVVRRLPEQAEAGFTPACSRSCRRRGPGTPGSRRTRARARPARASCRRRCGCVERVAGRKGCREARGARPEHLEGDVSAGTEQVVEPERRQGAQCERDPPARGQAAREKRCGEASRQGRADATLSSMRGLLHRPLPLQVDIR